MSLRSKAILETFVDRITRNKDIMDILKLPPILKTDTEQIINKKRKMVIDKVIVQSAQEPTELNKKFDAIEFDGKIYDKYGKIKLTVALAQSIKLNSYLFGNPQVDINIYYDNTQGVPFELLDLISDEFSGQNLEVKIGDNKQMIKEIKCEGITSQVAIINNFERVGIRFSFYATLYKLK